MFCSVADDSRSASVVVFFLNGIEHGLVYVFRSLFHAFVFCFAYSFKLCNLKLAWISILSITIWLAFLSLSQHSFAPGLL